MPYFFIRPIHIALMRYAGAENMLMHQAVIKVITCFLREEGFLTKNCQHKGKITYQRRRDVVYCLDCGAIGRRLEGGRIEWREPWEA